MPSEDIDLVTDIRMSILAQSPRGGRAILYAVIVLFFLGIIWASVSELDQVTRGQGKVIPSSQVQVIQNLEGGILSELLVKVGDVVKKDQLLLRIDQTRFASSVQENMAKYTSNRAKAARLYAEANNTDFRSGEYGEMGSRERDLYESRKRELESGLNIREQQLQQRIQEFAEMKTKLEELAKTYALYQKELKILKPLVAERAASEVEVLQLERQASQTQGEIETIKQSIPRMESKIREARLAINELKLNFRNKAKAELNDVVASLQEGQASSLALKDRLNRTFVRSPVDGTVNRLLVNTVGGVIQPGQDMIEIVPSADTLLVEAMIKPADIAFLRPNQEASVKFTAYDFTIYGGLKANLENISSDTITDKNGISYYLVRLRTEKNYLGPKNNPLPIIPGMVTTVDIKTGKKSVLSYLLKPVLRAKYMALREQ